MKSSPQGAAESLTATADFFTAVQRQLRSATTERDLEAAAKQFDSIAFDTLPHGAREDLAVLYAQRLFHITGGLLG